MLFRGRNIRKSSIYLISIVIFLVGYFIIDSASAAWLLGASAARFTDSTFIVLLIVGIYGAFKFDAFIASLVVAVASALLVFPAVSEWQKELGIYNGAFFLISRHILYSFFISFLIYSLAVNLFSKPKK